MGWRWSHSSCLPKQKWISSIPTHLLQAHRILDCSTYAKQQFYDCCCNPEIPLHLQPLVSAAKFGDVNALALALESYEGNIDDPVENGDTLLHLACVYGHLNCVEFLLGKGSNLLAKDEDGGIPLHVACAGGFTEIVQLIISHANEPDCVKRLLEAVDTEGDTPLHDAARGEYCDVMRLLLAHGACPTTKNNVGKTPLELADPETEAWRVLKEAVGAKASD